LSISSHQVAAWNASVQVDLRIEPDHPRTVLYLHSEEGPHASAPFLAELGRSASIIAPYHPGFGGTARIEQLKRPRDLAVLYLDLLDRLGAGPVDLVGSSLGAWIALEMATTAPAGFSSLVAISPLGMKFNARDERSFAEVLVTSDEDRRELLYEQAGRDPWRDVQSPELLLEHATQLESFVGYAWEPYLHEPALAPILPRASMAALVISGAGDQLAPAGYYGELVSRLPDARNLVAAGSGHFPDIEEPAVVATIVREFHADRSPAPGKPLGVPAERTAN
jgi:pimeloyl-ACP methyl ester carboxylesterase